MQIKSFTFEESDAYQPLSWEHRVSSETERCSEERRTTGYGEDLRDVKNIK